MKIQLWSIGKAHDDYLKPGIDDFTRRIGKYYPAQWNIINPVKNAASLSEAELKKKEAGVVLAAIGKDDFLVALDNKGRQMSSTSLAGFIQTRADEGSRQLIFLIGGAFGMDKSILERANLLWSLSDLTFPHQLVRLILAEQLYRACTINRNEKYHHA